MPNALLTGASKGLGKAMAMALAAQGYHLALVARSADALATLATTLQQGHPDQRFMCFPTDLSQPQTVCPVLVTRVTNELGPIDLLINNAGIANKPGLLTEVPDDDMVQTLHVNLLAPMLLTKHVLPGMVARGQGTVVNVSSIAGKTAFPYWSVYAASKFGLSALGEAVGEEQRSNGIRIINLHPGAVDTPIWNGMDDDVNRQAMLAPDTVAQALVYALNQPEGAWVSDITIKPLHSIM
jgi:short-subunit dehydrogenase